MGRALAVALMVLLGSGCFVFDELDSAERSVGRKGQKARKARQSRGGVEVAEEAKGPSLIERARAFFEGPAEDAEDEDTSVPPHPDNVLVRCWLDGVAQFTRKFDCQLRGGRIERLPDS